MDAAWINRLEPQLDAYLDEFADCFGRSDTREHLPVYVRGRLSDLPRKSVEPIALAARCRRGRCSSSCRCWTGTTMAAAVARDRESRSCRPARGRADRRDRLPQERDQDAGGPAAVLRGDGQDRQLVTTVHLGYAADDFHCLLDSVLYLPQEWADDRPRCRAAGIPDAVGYRPKWQIALDLLDRAAGHGVRFAWLTFDEGYGGKPEFLRELQRRRYWYMAEAPTTCTGWLRPPRLAGSGGCGRSSRPAASPTCCGIVRGCGTSRGSDSGSRTGRRGRWCGKRSG